MTRDARTTIEELRRAMAEAVEFAAHIGRRKAKSFLAAAAAMDAAKARRWRAAPARLDTGTIVRMMEASR